MSEQNIKNVLRSLRMKLCLTQKELAKYLTVSPTSISCIERGKSKPNFRSIRKIVDIARENGIDISYEDAKFN